MKREINFERDVELPQKVKDDIVIKFNKNADTIQSLMTTMIEYNMCYDIDFRINVDGDYSIRILNNAESSSEDGEGCSITVTNISGGQRFLINPLSSNNLSKTVFIIRKEFFITAGKRQTLSMTCCTVDKEDVYQLMNALSINGDMVKPSGTRAIIPTSEGA